MLESHRQNIRKSYTKYQKGKYKILENQIQNIRKSDTKYTKKSYTKYQKIRYKILKSHIQNISKDTQLFQSDQIKMPKVLVPVVKH